MFDVSSLIAPPTAKIADVQPQPVASVTNLSDHVDGGRASTGATNADNTDQEARTLWLSAAVVLFAIAILWVMGSVVFKKINL